MPVITCPWYTAKLLREHPDWTFLFGDNVQRKGTGGQAGACRYQPNALGIRTKRLPNMRPAAFFYDDDYARCANMIQDDFEPALFKARLGAVVVFPMAGLGTGLAELEGRAPRLFQFLQNRIQAVVKVAAASPGPMPPLIAIDSPYVWEIQRAAAEGKTMLIWTVYAGMPEFPQCYVARPSSSTSIGSILECLVDPDLDHLRERLPGGLSCMARERGDPETLVETWL